MAANLLLFQSPRLWPAQEHHVRHAGWTELFYDLVFAAAISQVSAPLAAHYSILGVGQYAFLLALIFFAWLGYTIFSTQYASDDLLQRALIISQIFLVAVMAANATAPLNTRDAAGFGAAYGGVRALLAIQYARALPIQETRGVAMMRMAGLCITALFWIISALLPAPVRYVLWVVAFLADIANSSLPVTSTMRAPPGAAHFPERFGLLTIILLGEFVASVMRGIESQEGWPVGAACAALLSIVFGFAVWSSYSDGAAGWHERHVRTRIDVFRLRCWVALHFLLFLGIGVLGVGARRAIAAPEMMSDSDQFLLCGACAGVLLVLTGIAWTSEKHGRARSSLTWLAQVSIAASVALLPLLRLQIPAALILGLLLAAVLVQTISLVRNQQARAIAEI